MSSLAELEEAYLSTSRQLHDSARRAWEAKAQVITAYLAVHHPEQKVEIQPIEDNLLAHDVRFPDAGIAQSRMLAQEVAAYLQYLLDKG